MKIDIAGPMVAAHIRGIDTYTPVVDGRELRLEHGNVRNTLANLAEIESPRREVVAVYARKGQVLVTFNTGESYLATGFHVPASNEDLEHLARFVFKRNLGGSAKKWQNLARWYSELKPDYEGPLKMDDVSFMDDESDEIAADETTHQLRIR